MFPKALSFLRSLKPPAREGAAWALSGLIRAQVQAALMVGRRRPPSVPFDPSQVRSALVVHPLEIGDMVMLTPFLRALRRLLPSTRITLVVMPDVLPLVALCPHVDAVVPYDQKMRPAWRPLRLPGRAWGTARRLARDGGPFDLALMPRYLEDNCYAAFLAYWSGARWRIGYSEKFSDRKRRLNRGFDRLLTHALDAPPLQHDVLSSLDLIRFLGGAVEDDALELWWDEADEAAAQSLLRDAGVSGGLLVALCPTGGHSALKQWPVENFTHLGRWLQSQGARVVLVGGPGDAALGAVLEQALGGDAPPPINATGRTTLRGLAALLAQCSCFVGNDAGPMHMAAAVGTPTVALFGSSCRQRFGPWGPGHVALSRELPCSPCGRGHTPYRCRTCIYSRPECLHGLAVEQVQEAVSAVLFSPRQVVERQTANPY